MYESLHTSIDVFLNSKQSTNPAVDDLIGAYNYGMNSGFLCASHECAKKMTRAEIRATEMHELMHSEIARVSDHGCLQITFQQIANAVDPQSAAIFRKIVCALNSTCVDTQEIAATYFYFVTLNNWSVLPGSQHLSKLPPYYQECFLKAQEFLRLFVIPPSIAAHFLEHISIWSMRTGILAFLVSGKVEDMSSFLKVLDDSEYSPDKRFYAILDEFKKPEVVHSINKEFLATWPDLLKVDSNDWFADTTFLDNVDYEARRQFLSRIVYDHLTQSKEVPYEKLKFNQAFTFFDHSNAFAKFLGPELTHLFKAGRGILEDYYDKDGFAHDYPVNPGIVIPYTGRHNSISHKDLLEIMKSRCSSKREQPIETIFVRPKFACRLKSGKYEIDSILIYLSDCIGGIDVVSSIPLDELPSLIASFPSFYMFHTHLLDFFKPNEFNHNFNPLVFTVERGDVRYIGDICRYIQENDSKTLYTIISPEHVENHVELMKGIKYSLLTLMPNNTANYIVCLPATEFMIHEASRRYDGKLMFPCEKYPETIIHAILVVYQQICARGF